MTLVIIAAGSEFVVHLPQYMTSCKKICFLTRRCQDLQLLKGLRKIWAQGVVKNDVCNGMPFAYDGVK